MVHERFGGFPGPILSPGAGSAGGAEAGADTQTRVVKGRKGRPRWMFQTFFLGKDGFSRLAIVGKDRFSRLAIVGKHGLFQTFFFGNDWFSRLSFLENIDFKTCHFGPSSRCHSDHSSMPVMW